MGVHATSDGISVQLYDKDHQKRGPRIFGPYADLFSKPRTDVLQGGGLRSGELPGSDDWLTDVVIASSKERFDHIIKDHVKNPTRCLSSCSSNRVTLFIWTADELETYSNCTTVAAGLIVKSKDGKLTDVNVTHIKVLEDGAKVGSGNQIADEFDGMAKYLVLLNE